MFRRWRRARLAAQASAHAAAPAATPPRPTAADLRGEHIFELLNARLSEFIGPGGGWSLERRADGDTDRIFHAMLTHQIAAELTRAILDERDSVAVVVPAGEESMALGWEPAPLIVWADPVVDTVDSTASLASGVSLESSETDVDELVGVAASVPAAVRMIGPMTELETRTAA